LVYPFVPPAEVDEEVLAGLAAAIATVSAFDCAFGRTEWFGDDVVWLAPEPAAPFRALTAAVVSAFPAHRPYGGIHDDVVPHLTIGELRLGSTRGAEGCRARGGHPPADPRPGRSCGARGRPVGT